MQPSQNEAIRLKYEIIESIYEIAKNYQVITLRSVEKINFQKIGQSAFLKRYTLKEAAKIYEDLCLYVEQNYKKQVNQNEGKSDKLHGLIEELLDSGKQIGSHESSRDTLQPSKKEREQSPKTLSFTERTASVKREEKKKDTSHIPPLPHHNTQKPVKWDKEKKESNRLPCSKKRSATAANQIKEMVEAIKQHRIDVLHTIDVLDFAGFAHEELEYIFEPYNEDEIQDIHTDLFDYLEEKEGITELNSDAGTLLIDQFELLSKYKDGAILSSQPKEEKESNDEYWRKTIPSFIDIPNEMNLHETYFYLKERKDHYTGKRYQIVFEWLCEWSNEVFTEERDESDEAEEELRLSDELAEGILKTVEMIILPHLDVLDRYKERNGKVSFVNIWNESFSDTLKNEVKDRDGWACVVCGNETDLHVHHKIPRVLGGVNHKDNLVTLCASCHGAIETADIKHAFQKCLANARRKKMMGLNRTYSSKDKTLLKQEVESNLDQLLEKAIQRDDQKSMELILETMKRLEVIFYD